MATRRTHSLEFKQSAVEASRQPGASIAGVAMAHGINANQLHKWRRQFPVARTTVVVRAPSLIPVAVIPDEAAPSSVDDSPPGRIDIESETRCAVVWNAWNNDRNIPDLGEGNHVGYLCVERGDVADRAVTLAPGQSYRAWMSIAG